MCSGLFLLPVGETWAGQCKVPRCLLVPPGRLAAPTISVVVFPPRKYQLGRNTHDSVISRRLSPIGRRPRRGLWLSGRESRALRGLVGGWVGGPHSSSSRDPDPGVHCPLLGRSAHFVQRVGGLVEGGVQVLHMMGWSMEGLPGTHHLLAPLWGGPEWTSLGLLG